MINSQYAKVGRIFPSSGTTEPMTTFTSSSGIENTSIRQLEESANLHFEIKK